MDELTTFIESEAGPWTWGDLLLAFGILLAMFVLRFIVGTVVRKRLEKLTARSRTRADDHFVGAVIGFLNLVLPIFGVFAAARILLAIQETWQGYLVSAWRVVVVLLLTWTVFRIIDAFTVFLGEMTSRTDSKLDDMVVPLVRKAAKSFAGILAFILVAQNMGYSVSGLLAGLGIGGLALAMAAKDTLANIFGSVMILVDRPFHVGDWITFSGGDGVVEEIGLRSTRVRTFAKTVISVPNQALANATVENHSVMPKRRIKFNLGVTYDATAGQVKELVERIEKYLRDNSDIDQEFMLIKFTTFNDSSLDIFVYCFTVSTDWVEHLSVRQDVNLRLMELVEEMGMSVAFPTRTVHLVGEASATETAV